MYAEYRESVTKLATTKGIRTPQECHALVPCQLVLPPTGPAASPESYPFLASAPIAVILDVNVDGVLEVPAELLGLLLGQGVTCDDCGGSAMNPTLQHVPASTYPRKLARR